MPNGANGGVIVECWEVFTTKLKFTGNWSVLRIDAVSVGTAAPLFIRFSSARGLLAAARARVNWMKPGM